MKRFFGSSKKQPAPSLQEATEKVDARAEGLEAKIQKLEKELIGYREQVKPAPILVFHAFMDVYFEADQTTPPRTATKCNQTEGHAGSQAKENVMLS